MMNCAGDRRICVVPTCRDASVENDELHGEECICVVPTCTDASEQPERNRAIANPQQTEGGVSQQLIAECGPHLPDQTNA